jgi:Flp pilus assembly protein TadG
MIGDFLRRLARARRGATIVEFGLVAPVMLLLVMGLGDMLYQGYLQSILTGAVQKAGRDSGIEGGASTSSAIDATVISIVQQIVKSPTQSCSTSTSGNATWCSSRKTYDTFTEVAPEPFTDTNGNGVRDAHECFTDENGNGTWDADPGVSGQGGASDVTLYTMSITYPRLFPVAGLFGWSNRQTVSASTLLKNQPYATQTTTAATTICT